MAECLFVAEKSRPNNQEYRATFIILDKQPENSLEGELIAQQITTEVSNGNSRRLEDGPFGGTRILLGETFQGEIVDCPLPSEGAWQMVGIKDISLEQTAYQMAHGKLWVEGMSAASVPDVPVARIGDVSRRIGPHHLDITGGQIKADGLPQGPFEKIPSTPSGAAYPCLWNHDSSKERRLVVLPDSHCRIREVSGQVPEGLLARAEARWTTATRAHYNLDLQFNSQSLIVAVTEQPSIGGRAWPTVIFEDQSHEFAFALWCNSTLGLLCHWWMSNKTQAGRGTTTVTSIPSISTLDLRVLSKAQHSAAKGAFEALSGERFLPFDQIDEDPARADLDRRLVVDVLGFDPGLCETGGPVERLRRKLATEPQVHSNKQTRLVFTESGESSVRRDGP